MKRKFKWVAEIYIDKVWVEDGFELTKERLKKMLENELLFSYSHETSCRIIQKPKPSDIAKVQGFKSVAEMKRANKR